MNHVLRVQGTEPSCILPIAEGRTRLYILDTWGSPKIGEISDLQIPLQADTYVEIERPVYICKIVDVLLVVL